MDRLSNHVARRIRADVLAIGLQRQSGKVQKEPSGTEKTTAEAKSIVQPPSRFDSEIAQGEDTA
jgi:hypothetical protein